MHSVLCETKIRRTTATYVFIFTHLLHLRVWETIYNLFKQWNSNIVLFKNTHTHKMIKNLLEMSCHLSPKNALGSEWMKRREKIINFFRENNEWFNASVANAMFATSLAYGLYSFAFIYIFFPGFSFYCSKTDWGSNIHSRKQQTDVIRIENKEKSFINSLANKICRDIWMTSYALKGSSQFSLLLSTMYGSSAGVEQIEH